VCNGEDYPDHAFPPLNQKQAKVGVPSRSRRHGLKESDDKLPHDAGNFCSSLRATHAAQQRWGSTSPASHAHTMHLIQPIILPAPPSLPPPAQMLQDKIRQQYRVRLILDNLPITTYDLEKDPESGG
jgi:hypothetical protein